MTFSAQSLTLDPAAETDRLVAFLRAQIRGELRRRGGVVGISGGIDSSVVLALAVRALGADRVTALILPEQDSETASESLAQLVARHFGVEPIVAPITPVLDAFGCYARRDAAIRRLFPQFDSAAGDTAKVVLPPNVLDSDALNVPSLTVVAPDGQESTQRLRPAEYAQIIAASNFKQRARMALLYYYAELQTYAVIGTANKNEHEMGFFVKHGDGGVDVRPIVHLFKTQVYQLAEYLDVPAEVRKRTPTSDTFSAAQTQQEFFFRLPFELMDPLWYARDHGVPAAEVAAALGLTEAQVRQAWDDFARKQRTTAYLRTPPAALDEPAPAYEEPRHA